MGVGGERGEGGHECVVCVLGGWWLCVCVCARARARMCVRACASSSCRSSRGVRAHGAETGRVRVVVKCGVREGGS